MADLMLLQLQQLTTSTLQGSLSRAVASKPWDPAEQDYPSRHGGGEGFPCHAATPTFSANLYSNLHWATDKGTR